MNYSTPVLSLRYLLLLLPLSLLSGCSMDLTAKTTDGKYTVTILPAPEPVPLNVPFTLNLKVWDSGDNILKTSTVIQVDATMPGHNHGMNTVPVVRPGNTPGEYLVEGMLFHMPGLWEIAVRIQEGGAVSEAKFKVRV